MEKNYSKPPASGLAREDDIDPGAISLSAQVETEVQLVLCVCDDARSTERDLLPMLRRAGYGVDLVSSDRYSTVRLLARPYQLVLFDVSSPEGTGYGLCQRTRPGSDLPLMMVLRGAARSEVLKGYQMGADAHILTPIDSRELIARITALLRRRPTSIPWA